jgi:hypothetical protein
MGTWTIITVDNNKRNGENEKQIISTPEYKCLKIDLIMNFIILASDGLWDEITNEFAVDFVKKGLRGGKVLDTIAKELTAEAIKKGSTDNISVVIVKLKEEIIESADQQISEQLIPVVVKNKDQPISNISMTDYSKVITSYQLVTRFIFIAVLSGAIYCYGKFLH